MKRVNTTDKANYLINKGVFNKSSLSSELGISRPTLNTRLEGTSGWKLLETKWINKLYQSEFRKDQKNIKAEHGVIG